MKIITNMSNGFNTYAIVYSEEYKKYLAIERKFIKDGKLTEALSYGSLYPSDTMEMIIDTIKMEGEIKNIMNERNVTFNEAMLIYSIKIAKFN